MFETFTGLMGCFDWTKDVLHVHVKAPSPQSKLPIFVGSVTYWLPLPRLCEHDEDTQLPGSQAEL